MQKRTKLLSESQLEKINPQLREPIEYRKSGLSINHIIGCPLDCSYCVRHLFGNFNQRTPQALCTDEEVVHKLLTHKYFTPNVTPIQIFNRATDPMLPKVKTHTFRVLQLLDKEKLRNHVLVITRWKITEEDCKVLNDLKNIRLTILVTYSGIEDSDFEPVKSSIAEASLKTLYQYAYKYKVVLYWRPLIPGINDSDAHIAKANMLARHAHATVFSGLFYREEIAKHYRENNILEPYIETARRKILPKNLEEKILSQFNNGDGRKILFRKTSCAVSHVHGMSDYNGHFGIRELCDICPSAQFALCAKDWAKPDPEDVAKLAHDLGAIDVPEITERAIVIAGLDEQRRYFMQHNLQFQVHDIEKPHHQGRHGRAEMGWNKKNDEH